MSLDRRNFLKLISLGYATSALGVAGCTHRQFYNPDQDIILGSGRFRQNDEVRHVLAVVNLQQNVNHQVDLDFLAHGIIIDPGNKKRLLAFEKNGDVASEINLDTHRVSKKFTTDAGKTFSGHAAFNGGGDTLFCAETRLSDGEGIISIRDGGNLQVVSEIPSFGENPHECLLIDADKTLVVTNTGNPEHDSQASICYIDIKAEKLLERIVLDDSLLNAGHLDIAEDGSLIIASAPIDDGKSLTGGVSIRSPLQPVQTMTEPELVIDRLSGEALSVVIDEQHNIAAVTHPEANLLSFWSVDKRKLIKAMSIPEPRGITLSLDGNAFIISYDANSSIVYVDTKTLDANTQSIMQPTYITGSHIYNWSRILTEIMPTNIYT